MRSWKRKTRADHKRAYMNWKANPGRNYEPWGLKFWRKRRMYIHGKTERRIAEGLREFAKSMYVEDCRYHPCLVTKIESDPYYGRLDIDVKSLVNGIESSCSYFHCGIIHLTEDEANDRAAFVKQMGMLPYQLKFIYQVSDHDEAVRAVRGSLKMERDWKFNENQHTPEVTADGKAWLLTEHRIVYDEMTPFTDEDIEALQDDINIFAN